MELIYATNAVGHMVAGNEISRAVRAHLLVDGVLNAMIASDALDVALPQQHGEPEYTNVLPQPREPEDVAPLSTLKRLTMWISLSSLKSQKIQIHRKSLMFT
ncbi:hypothetical protein MAR_003821 [Mya arenaria]|uniref:Uncharacterized protein n=1 Tax=Mya arenaria TaxID=6604 RepID=A0ABY7EYG7_MYAAR|nr:hypothetical protein MAR_003821 [Mya arenaria]